MNWATQLRSHAAFYGAEAETGPGWGFPSLAADLRDAAAEIERLRADRDHYDSWAREIKVNIDAMRRENDEMRAALKELRREHYRCDDTFYSCPKSEDGYEPGTPPYVCNCGADRANAIIDAALASEQKVGES